MGGWKTSQKRVSSEEKMQKIWPSLAKTEPTLPFSILAIFRPGRHTRSTDAGSFDFDAWSDPGHPNKSRIRNSRQKVDLRFRREARLQGALPGHRDRHELRLLSHGPQSGHLVKIVKFLVLTFCWLDPVLMFSASASTKVLVFHWLKNLHYT